MQGQKKENYIKMRKLGFSKMLDFLVLPLISSYPCNSSIYISTIDEDEDLHERKSLLKSHLDHMLDHREAFGGPGPLALHLEPTTVELRVSLHCIGCAKKVEKHISKIEGVTSFRVDLPSNKVVVTGDITPEEILESISKVMKFNELWITTEPGGLQSTF